MTREEVYDKCMEKIMGLNAQCFRVTADGAVKVDREAENKMFSVRWLLPQEAIDAIIDCAVEEAVNRIRGGDRE